MHLAWTLHKGEDHHTEDSMAKLHLLGLGLALAITACADDKAVAPSSDTKDQFAMIVHDSTTVEATFAGGGENLHLIATETEAGVVDITWDFGVTQVGLHVDKNRGEAQFMPNGSPIDPSQLRVVAALVDKLQSTMGQDEAERTTVENMVIRAGNLMMIVPPNEQLEQATFVHETIGVDQKISPTCQYQSIGNGYYRTAGRGCGCRTSPANGCAGRCGQGCGITSTPRCTGTTLYSKDCALHDYQLAGWGNAADDYLFFANNASCDGVGSCY